MIRALVLLSILFLGSIAKADSVTAEDQNQLIQDFFEQAQNDREEFYGGENWYDYSEQSAQEEMELYSNQLTYLHNNFNYETLNAENQNNYSFFIELSEAELARKRQHRNIYAVEHFNSPFGFIPFGLSMRPGFETVEDAETYIQRMHEVKKISYDVVEKLNGQLLRNVVAPAYTYELAQQSAIDFLKGRPFDDSDVDNFVYNDFKEKLNGLTTTDEEKARLLELAERALLDSIHPSYVNFILAIDEAKLRAGDLNQGIWSIPGGDEVYKDLLKFHTTTDLTADEIHAIGLAEVQRIHQEMHIIMEQVGFEGTLQEFFQFTTNDDQFYFENTEEGRNAYLAELEIVIQEMKDFLPNLFTTLPIADVVVKPVPEWAQASWPLARYGAGSPDGSVPGSYYINLGNMRLQPKFTMKALAYHEAVPGHHLQMSLQRENTEGIPKFRTNSYSTAFMEGWGLYAEYLPGEFGFYADPYEKYGQLVYELWRAIRLVVDTGFHAKRWSMQESVDYIVENAPTPREKAEKDMQRYGVYPGQATAYKIGMMKLLEEREKAKQALGDDFDIREFHDLVLSQGMMTLKSLERIVDSWLQ